MSYTNKGEMMLHCNGDRKLSQGDDDCHLCSSTVENISGQQNIQHGNICNNLKSPPPSTPAAPQEQLKKEESKKEPAMVEVADLLSGLKSIAVTKKPSATAGVAATSSKLQRQEEEARQPKSTQQEPLQQAETTRKPATDISRHIIVEKDQRGGSWEPPQVYIPQILSITPNLYSRPGIDDDDGNTTTDGVDDQSAAGSSSDSDYEGDNDDSKGDHEDVDDDDDDASEESSAEIVGRNDFEFPRNDDMWMSLVTQNFLERSTMLRRRQTLFDIYGGATINRGDGNTANQGSAATNPGTGAGVTAAIPPPQNNNNVVDDGDDLSTTDSSMPELIPRHMIDDSSSDDDSFFGGFHQPQFFFNQNMFDDYYYPGYCEEKKEAW